MSNRDSLGFGDLLPQDVVDIFAQEKHSKRGRKKRSHSLGRALGWLKGKKRKDLAAHGQSLGLGPALDLALDGRSSGHQGGHKGGPKAGKQAHPQAVPKRDDDSKTPSTSLFQENVFIEASRPKYVEDLHTEALEGLKMMQQQENNNGLEYQDNESTVSTATVHTDGEGGGFMTDSTIADSASVVSVQSSVSARSSRSGLTRQKSTFRPLNSGKPPEKNKTRRRHRKTVAGIPQHVQRELGLDRGWTVNQRLDEEQLYNGETDDSPTTDGPQWTPGTQRTDGSLQNITVKQHLSKDQLDQLDAVHAGHRDDLALLHCLGPNSSNGQRPLSLAVPWMTTASSPQQESPGPVMSMSPQAAYMSKIIPNAVLPPSIDVVEISRGRSRNSVRTVSKSSLLMSSPAPSRASSRASTRTNSSKASTITSASRQNPPNMSDSSCWSNSESSETLVSDNSTISSSSTPRQKRSQDGDGSVKEDKASVHSSNSKSSKCTSNGNLITKGEGAKKDGQFARSLSVIKSKRAPPPPNRSYSLHSKMKRRSRDLAEVRITSGGSSVHNTSLPGEENDKSLPSKVDSPGYSADTSSLDESSGSFSPIRSQLLEIKAEQSAKGGANASREASLPENKLSKTVSPSSGYSSQEGTPAQPSKHQHSSSPRHKRGILAKLQRLFPGSASAAQQPQASENTKPRETVPSETTVDAASISPSVKKLIDLFNIPPPPKIHAPPPPPPEVWVHSKRSIELLLGSPVSDNTYAIVKKNPKDRRQQRKPPTTDISATKHKTPTVAVESIQGQESAEMNKENHDRLAEHSVVTAETRKVNDILNGMLVKAVERREERLAAGREGGARKTSTQATEAKTKVDSLPAISLVRIPPSPSPPPLHIPPHPPAKQTIQIVGSPEMSWPPPPPPVGFGVADEVDFPLPPPPMFGEEAPPVQASRVSTEAEPQQLSAPQGILHPPLNIPPPPSYMAPAPPVQTASPATLKKNPPPLPKDVSSPPSAKLVCLPTIQEVSSSLPVQVAPPQPEEVSPSLPPPKEASLSPAPEGVSPPEQNSPEPPPKEISPPLPAVSSPCSEEATSVTVLAPPQSIPPPPPPLSQLPSPAQEVHLPQEDVPPKSESDLDSAGSILMPPSSIPPPPIELLQQPQVLASATEPPTEQEDSHPLPSEVSVSTALENSGSSTQTQEPGNIPALPPLPAQGLASDKPQPIPANTEDQTQEVATTPAQGLTSDKPQPIPASTKDQTQEVAATPAQEEPTPIVTPSLLQSIKLRSVNSSPEPPKVQEQPETQVIMRTEQSSSPAPPSSASGEAPQKPIRRSLILISPTSTTPPSIALSPPPMPKSQSLVITPASLPTVLSPPKKSPSAMTAAPSMNLQEAIRLRTAARSNSGPVPRLSLNSPTSPLDLHKSPSSTASFIFSKSNKKVVIETKPLQETKAATEKKAETETVSEESPKMEAKVPPPVAKKPKPKGNDLETSDGTEQTAGQEAQEPSIKDEEKTNGTASSVEEGEKPST